MRKPKKSLMVTIATAVFVGSALIGVHSAGAATAAATPKASVGLVSDDGVHFIGIGSCTTNSRGLAMQIRTHLYFDGKYLTGTQATVTTATTAGKPYPLAVKGLAPKAGKHEVIVRSECWLKIGGQWQSAGVASAGATRSFG
jgi:hypothetical protein